MNYSVSTRHCGCAWTYITADELPARVRRHHVGPRAVRFTRRCAEHSVMCRALEDWEIDMHGGQS